VDVVSDEILHVMSNSVLVDGALRPGIVTLDRGTVIGLVTGRDIPGADSGADAMEGRRVDIGDRPIAPAPLDLHLHGCGGVAVPPDGDISDIDRAIGTDCTNAGWGYPGIPASYDYVATLPSWGAGAAPGDLVAHVAAAACGADRSRRCLGLRLEGVFLAPEHRGVWPVEALRAPDPALLEDLVFAAQEAGSALLIVDIAPELPGAMELIGRACELGVVASLAHSGATYEQGQRAIDAGARMATHTFNAMGPFHHREPGIAAAVLTDARVHCEVIADGVHIHPGAIALASAAVGRRLLAVSDASPLAGRDGTRMWLGSMIAGSADRVVDATGTMAGSARLLTTAPEVLASAGLSAVAILRALTSAPRRVLDPSRLDGLQLDDQAWIASAVVEASEQFAEGSVHSAHG